MRPSLAIDDATKQFQQKYNQALAFADLHPIAQVSRPMNAGDEQ